MDDEENDDIDDILSLMKRPYYGGEQPLIFLAEIGRRIAEAS